MRSTRRCPLKLRRIGRRGRRYYYITSLHSFIHSLTHPLTHSLIRSPIYSLTHPLTHSLIHSLTQVLDESVSKLQLTQSGLENKIAHLTRELEAAKRNAKKEKEMDEKK